MLELGCLNREGSQRFLMSIAWFYKNVFAKILQDWISGVFGSVGWTKDEYDRTHLCFHATFAYTLLHFGYDLQAAQCHYFPQLPNKPLRFSFWIFTSVPATPAH